MTVTHPSHRQLGRLLELDGLRGWAAVWVVLWHLGWETFGVAMPAFRSLVAAAFNGPLAVTVFFVLSGEALSSGFFSGRGLEQVAGLAVKRLPRLSIPVFACLLITFILARIGLTHDVTRAAALVHREDWFGRMHPEAISTVALIHYPLMGVYASSEPRFDRLPFLWTMCTEMLGSLIVFVILLCWNYMRHSWLVVSVLSVLLLTVLSTANLADFCFGLLLSHARHRGLLDPWRALPWVRWAAAAAIPIILIISGAAVFRHHDIRIAPVLAPALVLAVSLSPLVTRFLSGRMSQLFGRLSFPLYLIQYPIMVTVTASAIVTIAARGKLDSPHALLVMLGSFIACLLAARLFEPMEALTRRVGQTISRTVLPARSITAVI